MANDDQLLAAFDDQARNHQPSRIPEGVTYEPDGPVTRIVGQHRGFVSAPRDTGLRGDELDELIARQRDYFAARGEAVEWKAYSHDEPSDLTDRLAKAGFRAGEPETVLIGLAVDMAGKPVLPAGLELRQVTEEADLRRIAELESTVWEEDWSWLADDLARRIAAAPDHIVVLVVEADGVVVSAAWLVIKEGTEFAGLWGGSTLRDYRGHGLYRALVARRAQLAVARGVQYLQVDASAASGSILRRLGFREVTVTTPYVWTP